MDSTSQGIRFTKQNRLLTKTEFAHVFSSRNRGTSGSFKWFARRNELNYARLGIAVPKRWVKLAVQRNRVKRLLRESFRQNKNYISGFDVVVIVVRALDVNDEGELSAKFRNIWSRVEAIDP